MAAQDDVADSWEDVADDVSPITLWICLSLQQLVGINLCHCLAT